MTNQIEIKIEGRKLTADKFRSAVSAFFDLLESVSKEVCAGREKVEWLVEVDHGSAIIRARADSGQKITEAVQNGLVLLQAGKREYPIFFNHDAVSAARDLGKLADADGEYISSVFVKNGSAPIEITSQTSATADDLLGSKHEAIGSVEGKIEIISDRKGFKCSILDPLYERSVICYFDNPEIEEKAYRAFKKRALARGLVRYDRNGKPVNIVVEDIREFPDELQLPTIEQVQAAYS
jgi:hypothetical protein